jgi:2-dehydropantoate 2-reductase
LRFLSVGVGAVGGVIAGRLLEAGHDVTAVARGAHLEAVRERGLRLETPTGTEVRPLPVVASPADHSFTDADVVLLSVKSQDTGPALAALAAVAPPSVLVVCAQNGVANERAALRLFPEVVGMCVMCPSTHLEPGVVQAHSAPTTGILDVGRYPSGSDDRVSELALALGGATFVAEARDDIMRWKHAKLLMNLGNGVEALCGPAARGGELARRVRLEGEACLDVAGIPYASAEEDAARRGGLLRVRPVTGQERSGGSTWQSLRRGTGEVEVDYLNGEVVLLGRLHGVPTPANELVQRLTNEAARARQAPGAVEESELLGQLDLTSGGRRR